MSLAIETRVNGQLIACIYIVNVLQLKTGEYLYEYELHNIGGERMELHGNVIKGDMIHKRSEGWQKLVRLILEDTEKQNDHKTKHHKR